MLPTWKEIDVMVEKACEEEAERFAQTFQLAGTWTDMERRFSLVENKPKMSIEESIELSQVLTTVVDKLHQYPRMLINMHYGLNPYHRPHTVAEMATLLRCTEQLAQLMLDTALEALRSEETRAQLSEFVDYEI